MKQLHNPLTMSKLQKKVNPSNFDVFKNVRAVEFNPYTRTVNLERGADFKAIPANKGKIKKSGRAVIIINQPNTTVRVPIRTKADMVAAFKMSQFLKSNKTTKVVAEPVVIEVKKVNYLITKVRKVMRTAGKGSFLNVYKVTGNGIVKYFTMKKQAQAWIKTQR